MSLLRRKPRAPVKRDPQNPPPDERIFGRHYRGPRPVAIGLIVAILFVVGFYLGLHQARPVHQPRLRAPRHVRERHHAEAELPGADRGGERGQGQLGRARGQHGGGHLQRLRRRAADPRGRHDQGPAAAVPGGELLPRRAPGKPERSGARQRVDDPHHADDHRRPDRRDPDLAPVGHQDQPEAGPGGVRGGAQRRAHRRRGRHPGPGRAGPDRRPGDQQDLPLRRQGGPHQRDRQPGVPGPASARPLRPDPRPARPVREARLHRRGAQRPDHELQHHRRGVRLGVRQPLGLDPRARSHPPGGGALAAPPERRAAVGPQAGARVAAGHPRAPGDDPRRLAVARAGGQAAEAERARRHRPAARRVGAGPRPGRPRVAGAVPADRPVRPLRLREPGPGRQRRDRRRRGRLPVQHRPAELPGVLLRRRPAGGREPGLRRQRPLRPLPGRRRARSSCGWPTPGRRSLPGTTRPVGEQHLGAARAPARGFRRTGRASRRRSGWTSPATRRTCPTSTAPAAAPSAPRARRRCREARDPRAPARLRGDRGPRRPGGWSPPGSSWRRRRPCSRPGSPSSGTTSSSSRPSSARPRR